jgi:small neutral amino acid transporter SnatA (MarC family)
VVTGAKVENASYGLALCAETVAVGKLRSEGGREAVRGGLVAVAVTLVLMLGALLAAGPLMAILGTKIEAVITRLLGVLLAALAAQFVIDGLKASF